jgi:gas vesicle structural protein
MPVARNPGSTSLVDILDRVLDQGIRFEVWPPVAQAGARSPEGRFRIVIEGLETHLARPELPPGKTGTGA